MGDKEGENPAAPQRRRFLAIREKPQGGGGCSNTPQQGEGERMIEITREFKVRLKVKIRCFDPLGPGNQDYRI